MTAESIDAPTAVRAHHGKVGVLGAAALVAGSMVGSGVYLLPATLAGVGSISILGWLAASFVALAMAGVFIWLAPAAPNATGLPAYVSAGLGRFMGVQSAFAFWASCWTGTVRVALAGAGATGFLIPALAAPGPRLAATIAIIWFGVAAAWAGPRIVARVEGLTLLVGLAPVILAATVGWFAFRPEVFAASWNPQHLDLLGAVKTSGLSCFWAFLGLECAAAAASVVRDPVRNVPRATLLGVAGTAVVYIAATAVVMGLLPSAELTTSTAPFADTARVMMGAGLGAVIAVCMTLRTMGCLTGWVLVTAETSRSAADLGDFPRIFRTRPGERASVVGLLAPGVLMTTVAVLSARPNLGEQFSTVINIVSLLSLYTYLMAAASLVRLEGRRIGPLLTALVAIAGILLLVASAKTSELALSAIPLGLAALLYLWLRRR